MGGVDASVYTKEDIDGYYSQEHMTLCTLDKDNLKVNAFVGLIKHDDGWLVCYTWCEDSMYAKKKFIKGIKFIFSELNVYVRDEVKDKHNIVRRILNEQCS